MKFSGSKEYTINFEVDTKKEEPLLNHVLLHNDDFTPMEFVIGMLEKFFFMDRIKAAEITLEAHLHGVAVCGEFARDFAEAKVAQVIDYAKANEHPLICSTETAV